MDHLSPLRPFGHGFEEPIFKVQAEIEDVRFYKDRETAKPKHTAVFIASRGKQAQKILFFNEVHLALADLDRASFLITSSRQNWQGQAQLTMIGHDFC